MKKLFLFAALISLASCEIYIFDDPDYWDDRDQFVGNYYVEEYSQTTERFYTYDIEIEKSCCRNDEVRIFNFYGADIEVVALVHNYKLTIPLQKVSGYEIEGTGRLIDNKLELTFFARDLLSRPIYTDFVNVEAWIY